MSAVTLIVTVLLVAGLKMYPVLAASVVWVEPSVPPWIARVCVRVAHGVGRQAEDDAAHGVRSAEVDLEPPGERVVGTASAWRLSRAVTPPYRPVPNPRVLVS
jgi:hypothetical protein